MQFVYEGIRYTQASGVVLSDENGRILVQYRNGKKKGFIPGGQKEGIESPYDTALREVKEEMGLSLPMLQFVLVDHRTDSKKTLEVVHFVFWGGILDKEKIRAIEVDNREVNSIKFLEPSTALKELDGPTRRRITLALKLINAKRFSNFSINQELII